MKLYVVIGYGDYEGHQLCDKLFTSKEAAIDYLLPILCKEWRDYDSRVNGIDEKVFRKKLKSAYMKDEREYVYFWAGADMFVEIFKNWGDEDFSDVRFAIKETELN